MRIPQTLSEFVEHWWTGSQAELAARLGISEGHLSHLISGRRLPSFQLAERVHELTGVSVKALMTKSVEPTAPAGDDAAVAS
jgi:transcriptional regulator with XRE-family HTH domain